MSAASFLSCFLQFLFTLIPLKIKVLWKLKCVNEKLIMGSKMQNQKAYNYQNLSKTIEIYFEDFKKTF